MKQQSYFGKPVNVLEDADVRPLFPSRPRDLHKGKCGSVAIVAGFGSLGAPILAARAALKSGAGYTEFYLPSELYPQPRSLYLAAAQMPAIILKELGTVEGEILEKSAIAYGMGANVSERVYSTLTALITRFPGTLVLDADALNSLSAFGLGVLERKRGSVILTPHPLEFSRLTGRSVEEIAMDPIPLAEDFSGKHEVTLVLKNFNTIITDGTKTVLNVTGSPALAKGGSGDVLSGFLAGSCARGLSPLEGASASSYLLGRAGEIAAAEMGEYSPDATDVVSRLSSAIQSLR